MWEPKCMGCAMSKRITEGIHLYICRNREADYYGMARDPSDNCPKFEPAKIPYLEDIINE